MSRIFKKMRQLVGTTDLSKKSERPEIHYFLYCLMIEGINIEHRTFEIKWPELRNAEQVNLLQEHLNSFIAAGSYVIINVQRFPL